MFSTANMDPGSKGLVATEDDVWWDTREVCKFKSQKVALVVCVFIFWACVTVAEIMLIII